MSRILCSHLLLPHDNDPIEIWTSDLYSPAVSIGSVQRISERLENLIPAQQKKMLRSISREAVLLMAVCEPLKKAIEMQLQSDPFSVGIYCALESVPVDYAFAKSLSQASENEWPRIFEKEFPPKDTLKINLGLVPSAISIFLGAMGPVTTFYSREFGLGQAFVQAEEDLNSGRIRSAVICTAHTASDAMMTKKESILTSADTLREGAAAILLEDNQEWTAWESQLTTKSQEYGISSSLVHYLKERTFQ